MALQLDAATLQAALVGYRQQLEEIEQKMEEIRRKLGNSGTRGASTSANTESAPKGAASQKPRARKHRMSAEGRARIAAAQRARWAKTKRAAKKAEE